MTIVGIAATAVSFAIWGFWAGAAWARRPTQPARPEAGDRPRSNVRLMRTDDGRLQAPFRYGADG